MGLLNLIMKPSKKEQNEISQNIFQAQSYYDFIKSSCGAESLIDNKKRLLSALIVLVNYETKYPRYFNHPKPTENLAKVQSELLVLEKKYVDYYMSHIANRLLKYSTTRGKTDNFNKETEAFRRFSADFLPDTIEYFEKQLEIHFNQYL